MIGIKFFPFLNREPRYNAAGQVCEEHKVFL